jgi:rod shape-determining protein MreD
MRESREASAFVALLIAYAVQTSIIARLQLPFGGPNLIFVLFLAWALQHDALSGALIGFVVGVLMDFAPPAISTAGAWTMVLCVVGYVMGTLAARSQDFGNSPIVGWFFLGFGLIAIFIGRIIVGAAIGESFSNLTSLSKSLAGLLGWDLVIAPLALWLSRRLYVSLSPRAEMLR